MKAKSQEIQDYIDNHHTYTPKIILREFLFMFFLLSSQLFFLNTFTWLKLLYCFLLSVVSAFGFIAFQRFFVIKGWTSIPPQPKYSTKTYVEHQADKAAKAAERKQEKKARSKDA